MEEHDDDAGLVDVEISGTCISTRLSLKVSSCQYTRPPDAAMAVPLPLDMFRNGSSVRGLLPK